MENNIRKSYKVSSKITSFLVALVVALNLCVFNVSAEEFKIPSTTKNTLISYSNQKQPTKLEEIKNILNTYYLYDVKDEIKDISSIEEVMKAVADPYTGYFSEEEFKTLIDQIDYKIYGIPIKIDIVPEGAKILEITDEDVAKQSGIKVGDIIVEIDGNNLKGKSFEEVVPYLIGTEENTCKLQVKRNNESIDVSAKRKSIAVPTVQNQVLNDNIGYIQISSFGEDTGEKFTESLTDLRSKNVKGYIVDLRFNPGGFITSALDIAGHLVGENPVVITKDRLGEVETYNGYNHHKVIDKPVIFLVNGQSASSSELLSAAVKDYGKAFFIGKTTYGKGIMQNMIPLNSGGVLKLTTHEFFSPKNNKIHKIGITPDFYAEDNDSLEAARVLLMNSSENKITKLKSKKLNEISKKNGDKTVHIKFNKELDNSTVNDANIDLIAGGIEKEIPVTLSIENGKNIAVNVPQGFEYGKDYYLLVNNKIKSKDGNILTAGETVKISVNQ